MLVESEWLLLGGVYWAELYPTIPIASSDNLLTTIDDKKRLIKFLDAPVDLIDATLTDQGRKLSLFVSSKGEWRRWIHLMGPWHPHKVLHMIIPCDSNNLLLSNKLCKHDGILVD